MSVRFPVGVGADDAGQILGTPGEALQSRAGLDVRVHLQQRDRHLRRQRDDTRAALGRARALLGVVERDRQGMHVRARARLGQHHAVGSAADDSGEVLLPIGRVERIDAYVQQRPPLQRPSGGDVLGRDRARRNLARSTDGVLQVEDQRIGPGRDALAELLLVVGRYEQLGAHCLTPWLRLGAACASSPGACIRPPALPAD